MTTQISALIEIHRTYHENPEFPAWRDWIEFVTSTYPIIMAIGDDGILYLVERT